jgi:hypothetical protein
MKKHLVLITIISIIFVLPITTIAGDQNPNMSQPSVGLNNTSAQSLGQGKAQINLGDINSGNTTKTYEPKREFVSPGFVNYPQPIMYTGGATRSYATSIKARNMVKYSDFGMTYEEAKAILAKAPAWVKKHVFPALTGKKGTKASPNHRIHFYENTQHGRRSNGTITVLSDDNGFINQYVVATMVIAVYEANGWDIEIESEGFQRKLVQTGDGYGIQLTSAVLGGNQAAGATGVLGWGHTDGEAGLYDRPWITVHVLIDPNATSDAAAKK